MTPLPVEVLMTVPFPNPLVEHFRTLSSRIHVMAVPARKVEEISAEQWARVEVLYTDRVLPEPAMAPALRWVQFHFAGIDFAVNSALLKKPDLMVTTLSGASAPQMAEHVLLMLLALGHHMPELFACQLKADWPAERWERFAPLELRGSTVGIVGYGSIGRELARMLQVLGVNVLAAKRDAMHPEDSGYTLGGLGDPDGNSFNRLYPIQAVKSMMKECDFVVICAPLTAESRNMIGEAELAAMKPSAFLIDVGRGGVVNPAALQTVLQEKRIAGAALDVFAEEPLPANSPFWKLPNTIITPHIGGFSRMYAERALDVFSENLKRYLEGQPLLNRFDINRGY